MGELPFALAPEAALGAWLREALELTFLLIYLLFYSAEDFFSFHFAGEEYVVFVMAGGCALTIVLQGCIIAALNSANEAAVKARATTLPPMLLAVIVMAEAAMQIIGLAMYWGAIRLLGEPGDGHVTAVEHIPFGHKFALRALRAGDPVIKYGARIGTATQDIVPGEHVHLHNMRSDFDERASTLDAETALPEDVVYELY